MPNTLRHRIRFAAPLALVALLPGCSPGSPGHGDTTMSVPFGLYAAGSYPDSIASMRMRSDGQYSMRANPHRTGVINPDDGGEVGKYEVVDAANIKFDTGAYAGLLGKLYPNYQGTSRMFIDVQLGDGTKQSYSFVNP